MWGPVSGRPGASDKVLPERRPLPPSFLRLSLISVFSLHPGLGNISQKVAFKTPKNSFMWQTRESSFLESALLSCSSPAQGPLPRKVTPQAG